jgi:general secretion pathway protein D
MRTSPSFAVVLACAALASLGGCKNSGSGANETPAPAGDTAAKPAPAPTAGGDAAAPQEGAPPQVREQRSKTLVDSFVADAKAALSRGDLQSAHEQLLNAYELDPANGDVRALLDSVNLQMGKRPSTVGDVAQQAADQDRVRRIQARLEVDNKVAQSDRMRESGDLDGAIRAMQDALLVLRWNPYLGGSTESGHTEQSLQLRIDSLTAARAARDRDVAAAREQHALEEKTAREREERERSQNLVARFLRQANDAFLGERYKEAADFCDQVLQVEPGNEEARELKQTALQAWRATEQEQVRASFKDHWREVFDQIGLMDAPVVDDLTFPSKDDWTVIVNRGPIHFRLQGEQTKPEDQRIWDILNNTRIELNFEETKLDAAIEWMRASTGANFIIDQAVVDAGMDATYGLKVQSVTAKDALELIAEVYKVNYVVRNGVVTIIPADQAKGGEYVEIYDVRDLVNKVASFPGSDFNLSPSGTVKEEPAEPPEPTPIVLEGDALRQLITENIDPKTWEGNSNVTINLQASGALVVRQSAEVHHKIDKLLKDLRRNASTMINIQTRFLSLEDRFLEDIGIDWRGLNGQNGAASGAQAVPNVVLDDFGTPGSGGVGTPSNPAGIGTGNDAGAFYTNAGGKFNSRGRLENLYDLTLGDPNFRASGGASIQFTYFDGAISEAILRAVSKSETSEVIHAPNLTVFNGQRAHINVLNHISYVKDFEVQIAQGAVIAKPIVAVLRNGPSLDVRPVVSSDKRFVTMEVRPTLLDLVEPIQTFRTSLAVGNDVELQLPEMHIQRLRTTVTIPDGSTLMLGGMKSLVDTKLRSGIPFLSDIPLVGFLASRNGYEDSKKKIMILVRAKILIPEEIEPAIARK